MHNFGEHIKQLREQRTLLQRQVASILDTAYISKFEKGEKRATREQVLKLADFFKVSKDDLLSRWLSEKIYEILKNEKVAKKALKIAQKKLNIIKINK